MDDLPDHPLQEEAASASVDAERSTPICNQLSLPVIEETLHVGKGAVDEGGFRITKRVEVHEQRVDELLRHERVSIERRPIGRPMAPGDATEPYYEGDTLVMPVFEEVVITETRLMLVEEVRVTRTSGTHRDATQVSLRKEMIEIERLGAEPSVLRSSEQPDTADERSRKG